MISESNARRDYSGKSIRIESAVVHDGLGNHERFEWAVRPPGVRVLVENKGKYAIVREFRYELGRDDFRLPGGKVNNSTDDIDWRRAPDSTIWAAGEPAAYREIAEETGLEIGNLQRLHRSICGATVIWDLLYFGAIATGFGQPNQGPLEHLELQWWTADKIISACRDGRIAEDRTVGFLWRFLCNDK
jgi:8-oxo-dGTP pyrophosphatase MutT (NUDIX family)